MEGLSVFLDLRVVTLALVDPGGISGVLVDAVGLSINFVDAMGVFWDLGASGVLPQTEEYRVNFPKTGIL